MQVSSRKLNLEDNFGDVREAKAVASRLTRAVPSSIDASPEVCASEACLDSARLSSFG